MSERATHLATLRNWEHELSELSGLIDAYRILVRNALDPWRPDAPGEMLDLNWGKATEQLNITLERVEQARALRQKISALKAELGVK